MIYLGLLILPLLMFRSCGGVKETIGTLSPSVGRGSTLAEFDKALAKHKVFSNDRTGMLLAEQ